MRKTAPYRAELPNLKKINVDVPRCEIQTCECGGKFIDTRGNGICLDCLKRKYPIDFEATSPKFIDTILPTTPKENNTLSYKPLVGASGREDRVREQKPGQCLRCEIVFEHEEEGDGTHCGGCLNDLGRI